jgi:hypothetical protein
MEHGQWQATANFASDVESQESDFMIFHFEHFIIILK